MMFFDSASGNVYVAKTLSTGQRVAIKTMDLAQQPRKELIVNEILVMKESQHPNIVNFLDSYLVKNNELWVIMEYMEGGALTDIIDNNNLLEEDQISAICFETCKGLEHLHAQSIIHRDIKSDNVLLNSSGQVKISECRRSLTARCARVDTDDLLPSRLWLLCQADGPEVEASHNGGHALLDGARGGQAKGVWRKGRRVESGHHGD